MKVLTKLKKLYKYLVISTIFAKIRLLWIAETILLALDVIREVKPEGIEAYKYVTAYIIWLYWFQRKEISNYFPRIRECAQLGIKILIRGP